MAGPTVPPPLYMGGALIKENLTGLDKPETNKAGCFWGGGFFGGVGWL